MKKLVIGLIFLGICATRAFAQTPAAPPDKLAFDAHQDPKDLTFAVLIDGQRSPLPNVTCGPLANDTAPCTAPLPAMTVGAHTIQIVGILTVAGQTYESLPSVPLSVVFYVVVTPDNVRIVKG